LSREAFLTITHDLPLAEALGKANGSKRAKLPEKLPEIQVRHISDLEVIAFNKGHARHARMWTFSSQKWDWMKEILSVRSAAPELMDLSGRDLYHFRSRVNYDPRIDWAKYGLEPSRANHWQSGHLQEWPSPYWSKHQLHHLPRWFHTQRPSLIQLKAS
jgi:hypothetical protein